MAEKFEVKRVIVEFGDIIGVGVGAVLGWTGGIIGAVAGSAGGYFIAKQLAKKPHSHSPQAKYQRASGEFRFGVPRTEEERRARHYALYGSTELPPRGTGRLEGKYQKP